MALVVGAQGPMTSAKKD